MNKFDLAIDQFGTVPTHTDLDLVTVLKLLSKMYDSGIIGYAATMDQSLATEVILQLREIEPYWADKVAQRLVGKIWERRAVDFGVPLE